MILILRCHTVTPTKNNCKPSQWARSIEISMSCEVSNPQSLIASHYSAEAATPIMADMPASGLAHHPARNQTFTLPFHFVFKWASGNPMNFLVLGYPAATLPLHYLFCTGRLSVVRLHSTNLLGMI